MQEHRSFVFFKETFFYLILVIFSLAFLKTVSPFLIDILLAAVLVSMFKKMNIFLNRRLHNRQKTALLSVVIITIVLALPLFVIGLMISAEATTFYEMIKSGWQEYSVLLTNENIKQTLAKVPFFGTKLASLEFSDYSAKLTALGQTILQLFFILLKSIIFSLTSFVAHFFITLFLSYYFFLDGRKLLKKISALLPLRDVEEHNFFQELVKITNAIIFNTMLVGAAEGIFGGLLFAALGISSPFFWGVIMAIFSVLPIIGTTTILLPATIIQFVIGNYISGFILLIIGIGGITINQNIIKPRLDGKKCGLHPALVFLGSMGGIMWLGMIGFLVGPLIVAMFIVTWNLVDDKYNAELKRYKKKSKHQLLTPTTQIEKQTNEELSQTESLKIEK